MKNRPYNVCYVWAKSRKVALTMVTESVEQILFKSYRLSCHKSRATKSTEGKSKVFLDMHMYECMTAAFGWHNQIDRDRLTLGRGSAKRKRNKRKESLLRLLEIIIIILRNSGLFGLISPACCLLDYNLSFYDSISVGHANEWKKGTKLLKVKRKKKVNQHKWRLFCLQSPKMCWWLRRNWPSLSTFPLLTSTFPAVELQGWISTASTYGSKAKSFPLLYWYTPTHPHPTPCYPISLCKCCNPPPYLVSSLLCICDNPFGSSAFTLLLQEQYSLGVN